MGLLFLKYAVCQFPFRGNPFVLDCSNDRKKQLGNELTSANFFNFRLAISLKIETRDKTLFLQKYILMLSQKRILVCPLDWGLGHASRCIPIIRLLLKNNAQVVVAGDGNSLALLKIEFPKLQFIFLKGYDISYSSKGNIVLKIIFSVPKILSRILIEHQTLKKIVSENKIDIVISDNRYGLWNRQIKSIFITHQLMIKTPFAEKLLHRLILFFVNKYDECWVPDFEEADNLSGDLSHKYTLPRNTFFVGALSRFEAINTTSSYQYHVMAIISGPEPQRSVFENVVLKELQQTSLKAIVICGKPEVEQKKQIINNIEIVSHLTTDKMQQTILNSKIIISRSGYSTIMDLATLGKKVIFIPTKGQTEQEYLAELFMQKKIAFSESQLSFNLQTALIEATNYFGFREVKKNSLLEKRISSLFN